MILIGILFILIVWFAFVIVGGAWLVNKLERLQR